MPTELQIANSQQLPIGIEHTTTTLFAQDGGIAIGNQNAPITINNNIDNPLRKEYLRNRSETYCNLFIVRDENFDGNCFTIPRAKAINKYVPESIKKDFADLNSSEILRIKTFPSLFLDTNKGRIYRQTNDKEQKFYYGFVTNVITINKTVKIHFQILNENPMRQSRRLYRTKD